MFSKCRCRVKPPLGRDKFACSQFFDALNDGTSMDAGDAGNGGVGGETIADCLIDVHFYRGIDGIAIHADLRHIDNDAVFNASVRSGF